MEVFYYVNEIYSITEGQVSHIHSSFLTELNEELSPSGFKKGFSCNNQTNGVKGNMLFFRRERSVHSLSVCLSVW